MAGFVPRAVALRHKSTKPKDSTSFQADGIFGGDTCASPVHTHAGQNTSSEATCQVSSSLIQVRSSELLRLVDLDSSSPKATVAAILPSPSILRKQPPTRRCDDHSASFPMNCAPSWHSQANAEVVSYSPRSNLSLSCLANSNLLSYPNGCVIWLSGLPDTLLNKLHVANLVTRILQFETGKPSRITIPASPSSHTHRAPAVIKYVDFQKGLDNVSPCSPSSTLVLFRAISSLC